MPKSLKKNQGDKDNVQHSNELEENTTKTTADDKRVFDDAYFVRRYKFEVYLEWGEYDEFVSEVTSVRDDMKEVMETLTVTHNNTVAYGKRNPKFKERTDDSKITENLRLAMEHLELSLKHIRSAARGANSVWNDIVHEAMDLQDSRNNKNDPEQAIYEVL